MFLGCAFAREARGEHAPSPIRLVVVVYDACRSLRAAQGAKRISTFLGVARGAFFLKGFKGKKAPEKKISSARLKAGGGHPPQTPPGYILPI